MSSDQYQSVPLGLPPRLNGGSLINPNQNIMTNYPQQQQQSQQQPQQQQLQSLSASQQQSQSQQPQQQQQPSVLIISNLPSNLTHREATLIFSLVIDDIINIEIKDGKIFGYFKNLNTCLTTGKLLDGKFIFGNEFSPIKIDYDSNIQTTTSFNNLRISTSNISPPSINNNLVNLHNPSHSAQGSNDPLQTPNSAFPPSSTPTGGSFPNSATNFDNFQKRQSIGNQRSRFLFSDPFSGSNPQPNQQNPPSSAASSSNQSTAPPSGQPNGNPGVIDLSDLTGKSLLFMDSHNDYANLVRDPWNNSNNPSQPASATTNQPPINLNSAPQTPGINANSPLDWSTVAAGGATTSNSAGSNNGNGSNSGPSNGDRRRTSSAFFNNASSILSPPISATQSGSHPPPFSQSNGVLNNQLPPLSIPPSHGLSSQPPSSTGLATPSAGKPSGTPQSQQPSQQPSTQSSSQPSAAQVLAAGPTAAQTLAQGTTSNGSLDSASQTSQSATSSQPSVSRQASSKDVPDLSLLARVPPPANPADQNPPCNTLYVGNLPPDATEAELRSLFSPQKGFRRLSFRTKNQSLANAPGSSSAQNSNHNHGPMCFVEFEDVAHATRALAELYGRALPRPNGSNGKGGIRLSFSKNPLGVRGPGNPRRTSTNQISTTSSSSQGSANSSQNLNGSTNGLGNYGYSNYHLK